MRAYHAALAQRRLGGQERWSLEDVRARVADAEQLVTAGRTDEAIALLTQLVEDPRFAPFADDDEGRAAVYRLGDALAIAGVYESARAYLRRAIASARAWQGNATYARRAVRRLVEIALESDGYAAGLEDVKAVPATAPEETRGEVAYLTGRAKENAGDPDGALAAYAQVPQKTRFWSQATYLQGLILAEKGRHKEAEDLFCKVADPKRQDKTTPVFADERFFAVRDMARLALGRLAHDKGRFDDARYYYYLVPRDSDRLAESLYESATSRYEKKDYEGARELLDELRGLQVHHRYEDESWILDAYIDLALCRFEDADKKLTAFIAKYEPVRDAARRISESDRTLQALLAAARSGGDAGGADVGTIGKDAMRTIAALVRIDPAYGAITQRRAVLEHEASGLRLTQGTIGDMQRSLATNGGVRPAAPEGESEAEKAADVRAAIDGVRHQLDELDAAKAPEAQTKPLREELASLQARVQAAGGGAAGADARGAGAGDLPELLRADAELSTSLAASVENTRKQIAAAEAALAKDAIHRLDLRLSRLLRRARLGKIESVLGRKRALEVEIEAINNGFLPRGAVDSLDAARYLTDREEYWPFEGDDWPDEFVGGEGLR
jgi:tetratricopeptide (TPR) repeat protein